MGRLEDLIANSVITAKFDDLLNWAKKFSLWPFPFVTACCGMEFMSVSCAHFDLPRFGMDVMRRTPRQSDLLMVVGTINHKQAPILKRCYEQMCEPKWVMAFGTCASCGGFYDNYSVVQGIDCIIPVDIFIPGCPPRPEAVLDGVLKLQKKVEKESVLHRKKE